MVRPQFSLRANHNCKAGAVVRKTVDIICKAEYNDAIFIL